MSAVFSFLCFFLLAVSSLCAADGKPDLTIHIPMRDGTELPTDIYLPDPSARNLPCILLRSPGGRAARIATPFAYMAKHQYVVAIQDTRCALDQTGKTLPYCTDGWGYFQDGYDTIEWLANSDFTNGKIGTLGASALGITQLMLAPTAPPALKCQYIGMAAANLYQDAIYSGGQFLKHQVEGWLGLHARDPEVLQYVCNNNSYNCFWKGLDTTQVPNRVSVPAIFYTGWYDVFSQGTLDAFMCRNEHGAKGARGKQKIVIGPWPHSWPLTKKLGDFDIPASAQAPLVEYFPERWFNFHLKDEANGVDLLPPVTYYVMGPFDNTPSKGNVWKTAENWPIPSHLIYFYLTQDHSLSMAPQASEASLSYLYDPKQPTPTIGGRNLFLESGPKDQTPMEQRSDLIMFTSPPLEEDLEVTGRIIAKLFFSSDKPDTDVAVRLTDVYPDGRSILIVDNLTRLGSLATFAPDKPCEVEVDLWSTSIVFAKGHSIRVSISSSNYPKYERNLNGSTTPEVARNTVFFGGKKASAILLPVVKE